MNRRDNHDHDDSATISKFLELLEKDIMAGNLVAELPESVELAMALARQRNVGVDLDPDEVIEGDVVI